MESSNTSTGLAKRKRPENPKEEKAVKRSKYVCDICGQGSPSPSGLETHKRIHTKEKPFKCSFCEQSFAQSSYVKIHERLHTKEKPHVCNVCQRAFTQSSTLNVHMRIHAGRHVYRCEDCDTTFAHKSGLTRHKRKHDDDFRFACANCDQKFTRKDNLDQHFLTMHSGLRPYVCNVCKADFCSSCTFRFHQRMHADDRRYACDKCDATFVWPSCLKAHQAYKHHIGKKFCDACQHPVHVTKLVTDITPIPFYACPMCYVRSHQKTAAVEVKVRAFLQENFESPPILIDEAIRGKICSKRKPDLLYASPNERVLCVEIDEQEHITYSPSCEQARMCEISEALDGQAITFIRFNPHKYDPPSGTAYVPPADRYAVLLRVMNEVAASSSSSANLPLINVIYLFYSQSNAVIVDQLPKSFVYS